METVAMSLTDDLEVVNAVALQMLMRKYWQTGEYGSPLDSEMTDEQLAAILKEVE